MLQEKCVGTRASFRTDNERPDDEIISAFSGSQAVQGTAKMAGVGWSDGKGGKEGGKQKDGKRNNGGRAERKQRKVRGGESARPAYKASNPHRQSLQEGPWDRIQSAICCRCARSQGVHMKHMSFAFQNGAPLPEKSRISQIIIRGAHFSLFFKMILGVVGPVNPPPDFRKGRGHVNMARKKRHTGPSQHRKTTRTTPSHIIICNWR